MRQPGTRRGTPRTGFEQQYGYFRFNLRMPRYDHAGSIGTVVDIGDGNGAIAQPRSGLVSWPAPWMVPTAQRRIPSWPYGEIDIAEIYIGQGDRTYHSAVHLHDPVNNTARPGYSNKDYNWSTIPDLRGLSPWNFAPTWSYNDAFYDYDLLMTPEEAIIGFHGYEICRFPMLEEYHVPWTLILSHQIFSDSSSGNWYKDQKLWLECDYIRCWQHPDWTTPDGGTRQMAGTANARTITSHMAMAGSYQAGRYFVVKSMANNSGATTININGIGAVPLVKYDDHYSFWGTYPTRTGTLVPLVADDLVADCRHVLKVAAGGTQVILLNPGRSWDEPPEYTSPEYTVPQLSVDPLAVETALAHKGGLSVASQLPSTHAGSDLPVDPSLVGPQMKPREAYQIVTTKAVGAVIGRVTTINTPTRPVRYGIETNDYFDCNPATGDIIVAASPIPEGEYEVVVRAFPNPAHGLLRNNSCTITITATENTAYTPLVGFGSALKWYFDFHTASSVTTVGSKISQIADQSPSGNNASNADDATRPTYDATGFNGFGCAVSPAGNDFLQLAAMPYGVNIAGELGYNATNNPLVKINGVNRLGQAVIPTSPHILFARWVSGGTWEIYFNGTRVAEEVPSATAITTSGWMLVAGQHAADTLAYFNAQNETTARLLAANSANTGITGKLAIAMGSASPISDADMAKVHGYVAHRFWGAGALNPLALTHEYKDTAPLLLDD